jgi:hypothetical protein
VTFAKHDVRNEYDDVSDMSRFYSVKAVPAFVFFVDGAPVGGFGAMKSWLAALFRNHLEVWHLVRVGLHVTQGPVECHSHIVAAVGCSTIRIPQYTCCPCLLVPRPWAALLVPATTCSVAVPSELHHRSTPHLYQPVQPVGLAWTA